MMILDLNKVSLNFGYGPLFRELQFSLNEGEKISIVGPNGCGKTTLLRVIAGLEKCDEGSVNIKKDAKVALLEQIAPDKQDDRMVIDVLKDAFIDLLEMWREMEALLGSLESETDDEKCNKILKKYGVLQEEFDSCGGYNIETNIEIVCNGLYISKEKQLENYNNLSGGERALVHIAKILLQSPDLLLLDEPTNHLDIERIEWLEKFVKCFSGAVVIVSHDRAFLDKVSDIILDLETENGMIYHTNYSDFLEEKKHVYEKQLSEYKLQQKYFEKLEKQAKRFADAGKATNSTVIAKKASVMFNRLEREKEKTEIKRVVKSKQIKMNFVNQQDNSKRVIEFKGVSILCEESLIIKNADFYIGNGEHVAIVGQNGSGKSSIVKAIVKEQELQVLGEVYVALNTKIGYIPQIIRFENDKMTICDYIQKKIGFNEEKSRSLLAHFLFEEKDTKKRIGKLSGGERIRLQLAILFENKINTLIFDEPTNHIDIPTKEAFEVAVNNFDGTVIAVSHDRFFINRFADKIIEIKDGNVKVFIGNYNDYLESVNK